MGDVDTLDVKCPYRGLLRMYACPRAPTGGHSPRERDSLGGGNIPGSPGTPIVTARQILKSQKKCPSVVSM